MSTTPWRVQLPSSQGPRRTQAGQHWEGPWRPSCHLPRPESARDRAPGALKSQEFRLREGTLGSRKDPSFWTLMGRRQEGEPSWLSGYRAGWIKS